jgi:hypothetical protein
MSTTMTPPVPDTSFRHEALLYAGEAEFVDRTLPFIRDGLDADEPTLVVVDAAKIERLRSALDGDADRVHFTDMAVVGHNPARIIPAWRAFVDEHRGTGRQLRGIGEPISATRSPAELVECQRHERCSTWPSTAPPPGGWCARTTPRTSTPGSSTRLGAATRSCGRGTIIA